MSLKEDIAAHQRGELDLEALKTRVGEHLRQNPSREDAMDILQTLYDSKKAGELEEGEYDELTQFVGETIAPNTGSQLAEDHSATRIATDFSSGDSSSATEVEVGMRLRDRFILDEVVGVGGMGTVYRGRDQLKLEARDRDPYVAVKVLNETFKKRPEAFIALQREASRQQRLAHPNIATVYDFDRSEGVVFITMEFLNGRTLDQFIKQEVVPNEGLPIDRVLGILRGLCAALSHAHERSIVHADFKPGNCFIAEGDAVKVLDFGIARAVKDPEAPLSDQTLFDPRSIGALTPAYASYEMLSDSEDADARDDIYALGCVTYELLTGRHPFHRIPADQAKANQLEPERIKTISRRQNEALAKALSFDRKTRTPTVQQFLEEMTDSSSVSLPFKLPYLAGAVGLLVIAAVALWVPSYLEQRDYNALVERLQSEDRDEVNRGLVELDAREAGVKQRVLQEQRQVLLGFYRKEMNRLIGVPDEVLDYAAADQVLARGRRDYPDSVVLAELANTYQQRKNAYLSDLAVTFESYLDPQFLLPNADNEGLPPLLSRIASIDPGNPLLTDTRIPGAYVDAAEDAITKENYVTARALIEAAKGVTSNESTLTDIDDRLTNIEQAQLYAQQVQQAADALTAAVDEVQGLNDLASLQTTINPLASLEPGHPALGAAGKRLAERFEAEIERISQTFVLADTTQFLDTTADTWRALQENTIPNRVAQRADDLMRRQDEMVAAARSAMRSSKLQSTDGIALSNLLNGLATIDPNDPRIESLREETFNQIRSRARDITDSQRWQDAREELAKADTYATTNAMRVQLQTDRAQIDELEKAEQLRVAEAERAEQARVAAAERQAKEEREAAARQAAEEKRLAEQRARQQAIAQAEERLEQALANFGRSNIANAINNVQTRSSELAQLEPNHRTLGSVEARLQRLVIAAIENQSDTDRALAMVTSAQAELGNLSQLQSLKLRLQREKEAAAEAERQRRINIAQTALDDALAADKLESRSGRNAANQAFRNLLSLVSADTNAARSALEEFAQAHAASARRLVDAQRFSTAQNIIDAGTAVASNHRQLISVQSLLDQRTEANRLARAEREKQARLAALQDRFENEVKAIQLTRAQRTLNEYRQIDNSTPFAQRDAMTLLLNAYEDRTAQLIGRMELTNATNLLNSAKALRPNDPRWQRLEEDIQAGRIRLRVDSWFAGESSRAVASIRQGMDQLERRDPEAFAKLSDGWASAAEKRLATLRNRRIEHNQYLADAKLLLPDNTRLATIRSISPPPKPAPVPKPRPIEKPAPQPKSDVAAKPKPATPPKPATQPAPKPPVVAQPTTPVPAKRVLKDITGRWCGEDIRLGFTADTMEFVVSNQQLSYPVVEYGFDTDIITVKWRNRRVDMVFEFGDFAREGNAMTQVRGRRADSGDWQSYNRKFTRCR